MHQTINELNSKSPLIITSSHLGLENEKILSLQSSLDYVLDLPFIGADSLVSVELMNTLLIETNTINQAFEKLNVECLSIRQLWSSLESRDKKLCDNLSILSRYFSMKRATYLLVETRKICENSELGQRLYFSGF